jgi:RimJ/RimL family protein N-acetyltransferase
MPNRNHPRQEIILRKFCLDDLGGIRGLVNNLLVTKDLLDSHIFEHYHEEEESLEFLKSSLEIDPGNIRLVISSKVSKSYLGQIALFDFNATSECCDIDLVIGNPNDWGMGIGSEAIKLAIEMVTRDYNVKSLYARIVEKNVRAKKCFEKTGFILETSQDIIAIYKYCTRNWGSSF